MKKKLLLPMLMVVVFACGSSGSQHNENTEPRPRVLISTSFGEMTLELYNETPIHRDNFLQLVEDGFYDQTLFHRVIRGFMIQGGDPESKEAEEGQQLGMGGPGYNIQAEILPQFMHTRGALAAARQGDHVNPKKESSGSQFYIVDGRVFSHEELDIFEQRSGKSFTNEQRKAYTSVGGAPHLDGEYTVYGQLIDGWEVLDQIAAVSVDRANRPLEDIAVSMKVLK